MTKEELAAQLRAQGDSPLVRIIADLIAQGQLPRLVDAINEPVCIDCGKTNAEGHGADCFPNWRTRTGH